MGFFSLINFTLLQVCDENHHHKLVQSITQETCKDIPNGKTQYGLIKHSDRLRESLTSKY